MTRYLDTTAWARHDAFEFFRSFDKPYFNVCTRLDAAPLKAAVAASGIGGFSLACYYIALRLAHEQEPFRYRLEGGRVRVYERVHCSTTVLRDDDSLAFAYVDMADDYAGFAAAAGAAIAAAREPGAAFDTRRRDEASVIHFTTLPWVHFTSFSHARNWGREDSVPKLAFGRLEADGERLWLPLSVEVHHALMDGVQVGRFIEGFEAALQAPRPLLGLER